jgi:F-type H+-transporting ATPase subunit a
MLFVLVANLTKLIPGYETIGLLEPSAHGAPIKELAPGVATVLQVPQHEGEGYTVVGFLRGLPTDLNFTVALAIFSVFMTQVVGVKAQGFRYFSKFFNTLTLFSKPGFGAIDLAVSILELISELAKILSFSFRLFGNMFAGLVLLILIGSMIPVFFQSTVLLFELFIGLIQAFVFGMLTMVFMAQATQGHGSEEH